jgi:outer membrane protein assembly factor BamB
MISSRIVSWVLIPVFLLWSSMAAAQPALPAGAVARLGEFTSKDSGVSAVAYSPDGRMLASGESKQIRLWDSATGRELHRLDNLPTGVYSLAFSPDGRWLGSGGFDRTVRLWDAATGKMLHELKGHLASVEWVAFSPDGSLLVSAGKDQNIRLWNPATGQAVRALTGHAGWVFCAVFTPDGKQLISGGRDMTIRIWDAATGNQIRQFTRPVSKDPAVMVARSPNDFLLVVLSPDGQHLLSAGNTQGLLLWNVKSGEVVRPFGESRQGIPLNQGVQVIPQMNNQAYNPGQRIYAAAFSPDGRTVATGQNDAVVLWETASGKKRGQFTGHRGVVSSVAFAPGGKTMASGSRDGTVLIWDLLSPGKKANQELEGSWDHLADVDAALAYQAICKLIAHTNETVAFLGSKLKPAAVDFQRIDRYIRELDDNNFDVRKTAREELGKMEEAPEPKLRQVLAGKPSLEMRRRVEELLKEIARNKLEPSAQQLQPVRAVEVLEHIGTPEAKEIVDRLAQGAPGLRLTEEAKSSLERLKKKESESSAQKR